MNVSLIKIETFNKRLLEIVKEYEFDNEMCCIETEALMLNELESLGYDVKPFRDC